MSKVYRVVSGNGVVRWVQAYESAEEAVERLEGARRFDREFSEDNSLTLQVAEMPEEAWGTMEPVTAH